eukprot:TRINITY_DN12651_c0_g2_i1.p1 TRINITY_DN12651_c0_g2~~TRINITY_DN12651_c0_g2_i1.p1  ORF type:complete len:1238 (-),score=132.80 TRINITY_DN12651_c0_g2_i1:83-3550(-)
MAIEAVDGTPSVLDDRVAELSRHVRDKAARDPRVASFAPIVAGYYLDVEGYHPPKESMEKEFVSQDHKLTVLLIQPTRNEGQLVNANSFLQELCASAPIGFTVHITGMLSVMSGEGCYRGIHARVNTNDMSFSSMAHAEAATLPVAILIMSFTVTYIRFLILPLFTIAISFVLASLMILPFMGIIAVPVDGLTTMGSLIFALCLDYSLFFLSRFSEHHMEGWSLQKSVDTLVSRTGKTVAISGSLIAIATLAGLNSPEECMRGTSLAMGCATIACVVTSVTVFPAMLLVAGKPLTKTALTMSSEMEMTTVVHRPDHDLYDEPAEAPAPRPRQSAAARRSRWQKTMLMIDRSPLGAIAAVVLLISPALYYLPRLNITGDRFIMMPLEMPALKALRRIQKDFPLGILDPYSIVITAPSHVDAAQADIEMKHAGQLLNIHRNEVGLGVQALGLNSAVATEVSTALSQLTDGKGGSDIKNTFSKIGLHSNVLESLKGVAHADCATSVAAGAGDMAAELKAKGTSNVGTFRIATRDSLNAFMNRGGDLHCSREDIGKILAASAHIAYNEKSLSKDAKSVLRDEMKRVGLRDVDASKLEKSIEYELQHRHRSIALVAAKAGEAAKLSELQKRGETKDAINAIISVVKDSHLSLADRARVVHAVTAKHNNGNTPEVLADRVHAAALDHDMSPFASSALAAAAAASRNANLQSTVAGVEKAVRNVVENPRDPSVAEVVTVAHKAQEGLQRTNLAQATNKALQSPKGTIEMIAQKLHPRRLGDASKLPAIHATAAHIADEWPLILNAIDATAALFNESHGLLLMPSGFDAMIDLCKVVHGVGNVASMLGPTWAYKRSIDWAEAVALNVDPKLRQAYRIILDTHVNGHRALLDVHTTFPTLGAGSTKWAVATRKALLEWEAAHPGFKAELSGGASQVADMGGAIVSSMCPYLAMTVFFIMMIVVCTFRSLMITVRLALALLLTLAMTFGSGVIVFQTPLLHGLFPFLVDFHGLAFETLPVVTGVCIALGLDYDIFLVSRIVEFRSQGYSDRVAIFRGATRAGGVISGAGLIMALCFSGLCFSNKMLFRQFGTLLVLSVLFDTFVVRTVLVPALMLIAAEWNWWPRVMPPVRKQTFGEVDDSETCRNDGMDMSLLGAQSFYKRMLN